MFDAPGVLLQPFLPSHWPTRPVCLLAFHAAPKPVLPVNEHTHSSLDRPKPAHPILLARAPPSCKKLRNNTGHQLTTASQPNFMSRANKPKTGYPVTGTSPAVCIYLEKDNGTINCQPDMRYAPSGTPSIHGPCHPSLPRIDCNPHPRTTPLSEKKICRYITSGSRFSLLIKQKGAPSRVGSPPGRPGAGRHTEYSTQAAYNLTHIRADGMP